MSDTLLVYAIDPYGNTCTVGVAFGHLVEDQFGSGGTFQVRLGAEVALSDNGREIIQREAARRAQGVVGQRNDRLRVAVVSFTPVPTEVANGLTFTKGGTVHVAYESY